MSNTYRVKVAKRRPVSVELMYRGGIYHGRGLWRTKSWMWVQANDEMDAYTRVLKALRDKKRIPHRIEGAS